MSSKSYMRPPEEIELDAQAVQAGRVGFDLFRGVLESIYRMGYEAGQKAATANITDPTKPTKPLKYKRDWLSAQTDDTLFDLYVAHVGFFDMNGAMIERDALLEALSTIEDS